VISELELSKEIVRSIAGKTTRKIAIGTVYPATIGVLPSFLARIGRKYPDKREADCDRDRPGCASSKFQCGPASARASYPYTQAK